MCLRPGYLELAIDFSVSCFIHCFNKKTTTKLIQDPIFLLLTLPKPLNIKPYSRTLQDLIKRVQDSLFASCLASQWVVPHFSVLNPKLLSFPLRKGVLISLYGSLREATLLCTLFFWGRRVQTDFCSTWRN